ncbi:MAG TPA: YciI family protein [bacterium]|jgi:uncharacterized protein YciI
MHFIYVLKLLPSLLDQGNWTPREEAIVETHFQYLKALTEAGTMILVERTQQLDEETFGLAIFEAATEEEARRIMENDPAVQGGIMTAKLYPFRVALSRLG